ncbi:ABC transporter permease [Halarsenatibacter silvermanii]|uniref:Monosaccharide ABC transporter membrane protein, CUT2 family n=1 Tax=Halarsenatibacter silvermanii TaxID=321763 RepID=A0A1G9GUZ9_9FIRM|nr:ABC transporter permease [Halarsenatibacter silvermanii]SDL04424.1 monosaccharide ABC transporter membrane protein, CUT2 family [Halarsenatibacter silvermanii]
MRKYRLELGLVVITFLVWLLFIITSPDTFLSPDIYFTFMTTVPFVGLLALGLTFVLAIGEINLTFPSTMAVGGLFFGLAFSATNSIILGVLAALAGGFIVGLTNGILITKVGMPSIVASLGMMFFLRGAVTLLTDGSSIVMTGISEHSLYPLFTGTILFIPMQTVWFLILSIFLGFILYRHQFGDNVLFTGDNAHTAELMGISVTKTKIAVFIIMAMLAALSGVMDVFRLRTWWPTQGEGYFMTAFATVFVGGTSMKGGQGTIFGTFLAAFLIGSLEAGIVAAGLAGFWTQLIYGFIIVVSVSIHTYLRKIGAT